MTARESLHEGADKKNPGNEGYGSLQGRASAAYSPYTTRLGLTLTIDSLQLCKLPSRPGVAHVYPCMYTRLIPGKCDGYWFCQSSQYTAISVSVFHKHVVVRF